MNLQHFKFVASKRSGRARVDGALNQSSFVMATTIAKMDPTRLAVIRVTKPQLNVAIIMNSTAHRQ